MRRLATLVLVVLVVLAIAGCAEVSRVADTTAACSAALDLRDRMASGEDEDPAVEDFVSAARDSENAQLRELADRAARGVDDDDRQAVEAAITEAVEVCEEEGSI